MVGNPALPVIADAYAKGIGSFDVEKAYRFGANSSEVLGFKDDPILGSDGTCGVPEFGTGFTRGMLTMLGAQTASERQARAMYACYRIYDMAYWNNGVNDKVRRTFRQIDTDFGIGVDDCAFTLWRDQKFVSFTDRSQDVRVSFYARPGKKLLYMANQDKADHKVAFTLAEKGGLVDAETGKAIAPNADGSYALDIPGHDLRALIFLGR